MTTTTNTLPCPRCVKQINAELSECPLCGLTCNCENCQRPIAMSRVSGPEAGHAAGIGFCADCELSFALYDRNATIGWPYVGPLTREQSDSVDAYERYCVERDREHELEMQYGGRTRCPICDQFAVEHHIVEERRDPTDVGVCKNCGHVDFPF
jgi:hypothetical protein